MKFNSNFMGYNGKKELERIMNEKPSKKNVADKVNPTKDKLFNRARKICKAIEERIGFDGDLIKWGVGDSDLWTFPNTSFALLDYFLGNEDRARKISKAIEERIGFDGDLIKYGVGGSGLYTHTNASFALLDYFLGNEDRARKISKAIEERIGFDGDLIKYGVGDSDLWTGSNASFALFLLREKFREGIK